MQNFPLDTLKIGESVRLLVSATKPDAHKWRDFTPVDVTRESIDHWRIQEKNVGPCIVVDESGHRAMQQFAKSSGVSHWYEYARERDLILQHYAARRRKAVGAARIDLARRDSIMGAEYAAKHYPATATECLAAARRDVLENVRRYSGNSIWKGLGGSDGATSAAYGEKACRWLEDPESKGLRFVGLQGDLSTDRNAATGYYLDEYGGETVSGVVYQLPTRKGEMRFLAGYADPFNSDKYGRGPAYLSLEIHSERIESGPVWNDYYKRSFYRDRQEACEIARKDAIYSAVQTADSMASRMAEEEREYQEAHRLGRDAREKATEALTAGKAWVSAMRELRSTFKARHKAGILGQSVEQWRRMVREQIGEVRELCEAWQDARAEAHSAMRQWSPNDDAFKEGYAEGNA